MPGSYFSEKTLDDVMYAVIGEIQGHGESVRASKGPMKELTGVLIELIDPRKRLSRTETRGKPFSCLGELCWYLAGTKDLAFICYYIPRYTDFADGDDIFGAYGPRLFDWKGLNQLKNVAEILTRKPSSRQAVIQLFDASDIVIDHKDVPCTCTLQFMIRGNKLHLFTSMRSNDAYLGLPHDIFSFTMLQEIMARKLNVEIGTYKHAVGSLHLYDENADAALQFINEGLQSTQDPMPPMPAGDPWPSIGSLLKAESSIRNTGSCDSGILASVDPYWADLIRLLLVLKCKRNNEAAQIRALQTSMCCNVYSPFIEKVLSELD